jgi:hypothetical protein
MKPEEQKIKNIIDKVFDKYKKVLKGTLMWKWEDKTKIADEIIEKVILEFPKLIGKEKIIFAKLMARFIHTKKNYPFKEFFTIDKAFDVTPESILELIEEETSIFNKYLNIINESQRNERKLGSKDNSDYKKLSIVDSYLYEIGKQDLQLQIALDKAYRMNAVITEYIMDKVNKYIKRYPELMEKLK